MRPCPFQLSLYYICLPTSHTLQPVGFHPADSTVNLPNSGCPVPKEAIRTSNVLTANLFFTAEFGDGKAVTALSALIVISTFGNILTTIIASSRIIRECGRWVYLLFDLYPSLIIRHRQGVLPFTKFWVSTQPFNTPLGPYLTKWLLTTIVIIAPPPGDAFDFSLSPHFNKSALHNRAHVISRRPAIVSGECLQFPDDAGPLLCP